MFLSAKSAHITNQVDDEIRKFGNLLSNTNNLDRSLEVEVEERNENIEFSPFEKRLLQHLENLTTTVGKFHSYY
jgi:hypothetical protein